MVTCANRTKLGLKLARRTAEEGVMQGANRTKLGLKCAVNGGTRARVSMRQSNQAGIEILRMIRELIRLIGANRTKLGLKSGQM